ncbi:MAG: hypothetical protein ABIF89_00640 [bacterium]
MKIIAWLREKPESVRRVIIWVIVVVIGLIMLVVWGNGFSKRIERIQANEKETEFDFINEFNDELKRLPQPELPEVEIPQNNAEEEN